MSNPTQFEAAAIDLKQRYTKILVCIGDLLKNANTSQPGPQGGIPKPNKAELDLLSSELNQIDNAIDELTSNIALYRDQQFKQDMLSKIKMLLPSEMDINDPRAQKIIEDHLTSLEAKTVKIPM